MNNRDVAIILFNISTILTQQYDNPYRIRAYRRAARNILRLRYSIAERVAKGQPLGIPQLGASLTTKISTLASTGQLPFYDELCAQLPPEQQYLMRVPGMGPTIAARIHRDLGHVDAVSLARAAATGALQRVWGVGPKRTVAIIDTLVIPMLPQSSLSV
ncbi:MAG: Histidinol phosphatase or related hydrolase of the PHP family [Chloroflexi bacterium AL-W]|nr:Histidinol phosphatase or related hydrolase of the PHP family [Chloroflexi bacterium AL-N1]NOK69497.1 Histidinol phosphatase or related hydrolase of the PHP family [Chloroflexi bacterium AL-N10]NOK77462.1 Histidinol phosphatase or related hydrolase of the PHP family [Chloroflexi bacterium AL-N5]NOK84313.1 Histidinol phosphatase or related hydrolase of the PHP family [Chloroflexi bacterium AL-W]NOK91521.1 Histidinol phosphatase or related hydrolase of the PHP family [Chloroflexi bacterium AL-